MIQVEADSRPHGWRGVGAWRGLLFALFCMGGVQAQEYRITTVAGGFVGDGGPATNANVSLPIGVALHPNGDLYIAERARHRIRRVSPGGVITTVAGTGVAGYSGNDRKAGLAPINGPQGIAIDAAGTVYFSDSQNHRVRRILPGGDIATVAGTGVALSSGDGGAATRAGIPMPGGLAFDAAGNLYVAESLGHRIRKITPTGLISTFAGNGVAGWAGDGGPAVNANLTEPAALAFDATGNLYIADSGNYLMRRVTPGGVISSVDSDATSIAVLPYHGVAVDATGNLYVGDVNCFIYRITPGGAVSRFAGGNGTCAYDGDGGSASAAAVSRVEGMAFAANGDLYFSDSGNYRVRKINSAGVISTVAGLGALRDGSAAEAIFATTLGLGIDGGGNIYIADTNRRIRKVTPSGFVSTLAGNGSGVSDGDGGPAINGGLKYPADAAVDGAGNVFIADDDRVRMVSTTGVITTVAGAGGVGFSGDGGPATAAKLFGPSSIAIDAAGYLFIADRNNHRVRMIGPDGIITTVAGNGTRAFGGDGGAATAASLSFPNAVALDAAGNLYISDYGNLRVRKVTPGGVISTIAGNGTLGQGGDGAAATAAQLKWPTGIAVDAEGNVFIAGGTVRKVDWTGTITTVHGLTHPAHDVAVSGNGVLYISAAHGRVLRGAPVSAATRKP